MSAATQLFKRYRTVWQSAWQQRKQMDAPLREPHEIEFLPRANIANRNGYFWIAAQICSGVPDRIFFASKRNAFSQINHLTRL